MKPDSFAPWNIITLLEDSYEPKILLWFITIINLEYKLDRDLATRTDACRSQYFTEKMNWGPDQTGHNHMIV